MPELSDVISRVALLRFHVDHLGHVWFGNDTVLAYDTARPVDEFFANYGHIIDRAGAVRILGVPTNANLILKVQAYLSRCKVKNKPSVSIGSRLACTGSDPETVLRELLQVERTSLLPGCWHRLSSSDYCVYSLLSEWNTHHCVTDLMRHTVQYHPAWPAVTFIAHADLDAACQLLCEIIDPRWFLHPHRPARRSRLLTYLGVTPDNAAAFVGAARSSKHYERSLLAFSLWYNEKSFRANLDQLDPPSNFVWRSFQQHDTLVRGLLRATSRMLAFICSYWLSKTNPHAEATFDASLILKSVEECEAFEAHLSQIRTV